MFFLSSDQIEALQWRHNKTTTECEPTKKAKMAAFCLSFFDLFNRDYLANEKELSRETSQRNYWQ